jgi:hypothetical protein
LQAVLEVQFFFFKLHDISAGHSAFFFITCNELTLSLDFSVQVDGSVENLLIIFAAIFYVPTVDSIAFYFLILHIDSQDSI